MGLLDNIDPAMFMQMLSAQNHDPFSKQLPGDRVLPQMGGQQPQGGMQPQQEGLPQSLSPEGQPVNQPQSFNNVSTDFANLAPGLPNLPDSFTGFGFGQNAPKQFHPMGIRQQLIQQLLSHMPSMNKEMPGYNSSNGIASQGLGGMSNGFAG